jgi:hypothetical protein
MNTPKLHRLDGRLAAPALALLILVPPGCASKPAARAAPTAWVKKVRSDPTPELESLSMTHEQRKNIHVYTVDTNMRQIWDDLDMILLLNRPLRFSRNPLP